MRILLLAMAALLLASPIHAKPAHAKTWIHGCHKNSKGVTVNGSVVLGTSGNDCIYLAKEAGPFEVNAVAGNDKIVGSNGNDVIHSGWLPNEEDGGPGDDTYVMLNTSGPNKTVDSGGGYDRIVADGTIIRLHNFGPENSIEEINGNGNVGVRIFGTNSDDVLDFSQTKLIGIACIATGLGNDILVLGANVVPEC